MLEVTTVQGQSPREVGRYAALAQVGMEMVAPMVIGVLLDSYFGWTPWATVTGFVIGFVGGFIHLLVMLKRFENKR
jgi:F0F1-type ATP synthase assembly protein I